MNRKREQSFFSVAFDLIAIDRELPYDLYVNSSSIENREKFVRIYPQHDMFNKDDLLKFKQKYHQLYVPESQRQFYLKSLLKNKKFCEDKLAKTEIIKDSAIEYLKDVFNHKKEFTTEFLEETVEGCRESVEHMVEMVRDYTIHELRDHIGLLSFHDFYTYDHSVNVAMYSISLYKTVRPKAKKEDLVMSGLGGLLHDIGKTKISTEIINNPGKLSESDFQVIKNHPRFGKEILEEKPCECEGVDFEIIKRVIYEHHENYNGTGYPNKLEGEEIHVMARITAIADFFDAITTKRSYHDVLTTDEALSLMAKSVGRKIDPEIFEAFTKNVKKLVLERKITEELPDDFDPCRPHNELPFQVIKNGKFKKIDHDLLEKTPTNIGKVAKENENFLEKDQSYGKVGEKKSA